MSIQFAPPTIVVVAFNRPKSLERILGAIARADYEGYRDIPLVISIDKSDCAEVSEIARNFAWRHGPKQVIEHEMHLGLRKHIISCGDLTERYGAVIVLEDDLFVSPAFYDYAVQAMQFYSDEEDVSGISLYSYDFNEYARMRFWPIDDGYDNYFIQSASSWGQLWTSRQWDGFKQWYTSNVRSSVSQDDPLPDRVIGWPESSWKKYFIKYMVLENKYFVYPRVSLSTNFGDAGTHRRVGSISCQVPLSLKRKAYNFGHLGTSASIYDSHYEMESRCLKLYNRDLVQIDFASDFYGTKDPSKVGTEYLLSVRECTSPIASYSMSHVPHELNAIFNIKGDFFHLGRVSDFGEVKQQKRLAQLRHLHKDLGLRRYGLLFLTGLLECLGLRIKSMRASGK